MSILPTLTTHRKNLTFPTQTQYAPVELIEQNVEDFIPFKHEFNAYCWFPKNREKRNAYKQVLKNSTYRELHHVWVQMATEGYLDENKPQEYLNRLEINPLEINDKASDTFFKTEVIPRIPDIQRVFIRLMYALHYDTFKETSFEEDIIKNKHSNSIKLPFSNLGNIKKYRKSLEEFKCVSHLILAAMFHSFFYIVFPYVYTYPSHFYGYRIKTHTEKQFLKRIKYYQQLVMNIRTTKSAKNDSILKNFQEDDFLESFVSYLNVIYISPEEKNVFDEERHFVSNRFLHFIKTGIYPPLTEKDIPFFLKNIR